MKAHNRKDETGKRYGFLVVVGECGVYRRQVKYECICDCGNKTIATGANLRRGDIKSCGCYRLSILKTSNITHGKSNESIYHIWQGIRARCLKENSHAYKNYGGRGITICDKWLTFQGFYEDMGDRPDGLSIERIDNNRGYCKENCRWATYKDQANNSRRNVKVTFNGIALNVSQWCEKLGLKYPTIRMRIHRGSSPMKALGLC